MGIKGAENRIYTAMRDVGNAFVFEPSDNGSVMCVRHCFLRRRGLTDEALWPVLSEYRIRPADRTQYTMNVEGGNRGNATKVRALFY